MQTPEPKFTLEKLVAAAANEGIPVGAIARIVDCPFGEVYPVLLDAKAKGWITDMPRSDWPPGTRAIDRLPSIAMPSDDDLAFLCKKSFKLTNLEALFLVSLLKHRQVEKTRLHNIVEQQRMTRASQPDRNDPTDPKMVDVMICKLRKKLKAPDKRLMIETIWGGGYYVEPAVKTLIVAHVNGEPHAIQKTPAPGSAGSG